MRPTWDMFWCEIGVFEGYFGFLKGVFPPLSVGEAIRKGIRGCFSWVKDHPLETQIFPFHISKV